MIAATALLPSACGGSVVTGFGTAFSINPQEVESVLHSFGSGGSTDGLSPMGSLLLDSATGNLYGAASAGGAYGAGTVFEIAGGTESTLWSFGGTGTGAGGGWNPYAGLVMDSATGNLYGTTVGGGAAGAGTVFEIRH